MWKRNFLYDPMEKSRVPFNKAEVIESIRQGSISFSDEVAEPFRIWKYIKDHTEFKEDSENIWPFQPAGQCHDIDY